MTTQDFLKNIYFKSDKSWFTFDSQYIADFPIIYQYNSFLFSEKNLLEANGVYPMLDKNNNLYILNNSFDAIGKIRNSLIDNDLTTLTSVQLSALNLTITPQYEIEIIQDFNQDGTSLMIQKLDLQGNSIPIMINVLDSNNNSIQSSDPITNQPLFEVDGITPIYEKIQQEINGVLQYEMIQQTHTESFVTNFISYDPTFSINKANFLIAVDSARDEANTFRFYSHYNFANNAPQNVYFYEEKLSFDTGLLAMLVQRKSIGIEIGDEIKYMVNGYAVIWLKHNPLAIIMTALEIANSIAVKQPVELDVDKFINYYCNKFSNIVIKNGAAIRKIKADSLNLTTSEEIASYNYQNQLTYISSLAIGQLLNNLEITGKDGQFVYFDEINELAQFFNTQDSIETMISRINDLYKSNKEQIQTQISTDTLLNDTSTVVSNVMNNVV